MLWLHQQLQRPVTRARWCEGYTVVVSWVHGYPHLISAAHYDGCRGQSLLGTCLREYAPHGIACSTPLVMCMQLPCMCAMQHKNEAPFGRALLATADSSSDSTLLVSPGDTAADAHHGQGQETSPQPQPACWRHSCQCHQKPRRAHHHWAPRTSRQVPTAHCQSACQMLQICGRTQALELINRTHSV